MCGIAGLIHADRAGPVEAPVLETMAERIAHRGPDDEGVFVRGRAGLAHRRLSVIDVATGRQPMAAPDGSAVVVFNGEIYNYVELREDLKRRGREFRTQSDTEVLLALYLEKGEACLDDLNGMFSFAILDFRRNRLFAARDRFGIKPFYYCKDGSRFAFASEIKALLAVPGLATGPDYGSIRSYLAFQFSLGEQTFFRNVKSLKPGHALTVDLDTLEVRQNAYWDLNFEKLDDSPVADLVERLRWLLQDAVRLQLRSDVPVGCYLSGGLDSTVVTSLAARLGGGKKLKTFTGAFKDAPEYDETAYAREVSRRVGSEYHEIFPTPADFIDTMPALVRHMDEPIAGPGAFPQYLVSRLASREVKVILGGQGGDEIFAGYTRYLVAYLEECLRGAIFETQRSEDPRFVVTFHSILSNLPALKDYVPLLKHFWSEGLFAQPADRYLRLVYRCDGLENLLTGDLKAPAGDETAFQRFRDLFESLTDKSLINKMVHFDVKTLLPALLHVEDRVSMAHSLESRVPFLDHRIAELMASIPPKIKFEGGQAKHLLREAVADWVPARILDRKDKKGFPVPLTAWLKGPLRDWVRDLLRSKKAVERGLYSMDAVNDLLDNEREFGRKAWGLINVELWFQQFGDAL